MSAGIVHHLRSPNTPFTETRARDVCSGARDALTLFYCRGEFTGRLLRGAINQHHEKKVHIKDN